MEFISKIQNEIISSKMMDTCCYKVDTDNNLVLFFDNTFDDTLTTYKYKNIIYDIITQQPIVSQYNQPITGMNNIKTFINENDIDENIDIKFCYEGTHIVVFNHNNKWFITTRKCLDARESKWNGKSHYDMFMEAITGKFNLNDLNKNYCYHFNLIHNQNFRSIKYSSENDFMILDLIFITEKNTLKEIEINDETFPALDFMAEIEPQKIKGNKEEIMKSIERQYQMTIDKIDNNKQKEIIKNGNMSEEERKLRMDYLEKDSKNVYLTFEGVAIIMHIKGDNKPVICKIQNPLYSYTYSHPVSKFDLNYPKYDIIYTKFVIDTCKSIGIKPIINKQVFIKNNNDPHGIFKVVQVDISDEEEEVNNLIKFFDNELVNNALVNMKNNINNLAYLIKDIYFQFLKPNDAYNHLPDSYKTIKYLIHGLYLNQLEINKSACNGEKVCMTQDIIYKYLLTYNPDSIKELIINYPDAIKVMYGMYNKNDKGTKRYHLIKFPQHIMKGNVKKDKK